MRTTVIRIGGLALALVLSGSARATGQEDSSSTINVEVDYMAQSGASAHTHKLEQGEVDALVQMFACHNITLNIVVDDQLPHITTMQTTDPEDDFFTGDGAGFKLLKDGYFDHDGDSGWHYCVMGHNFLDSDGATGYSGKGEVDGDDFAVTLGSFLDASGKPIGTPFERAATFAHELGHNLGLEHYPLAATAAAGNTSPYYASVMSYAYQLNGVRSGLLYGSGNAQGALIGGLNLYKELDYSNGRLPIGHEAFLVETSGVGIVKVDWDCDGTIENGLVSHELDTADDYDDSWCNETGVPWIVMDQDDWSIIHGNLSSLAPKVPHSSGPCAPVKSSRPSTYGSYAGVTQPTLVTEACIDAEMYWVAEDGALGANGSGSAPTYALIMSYASQSGVLPDGSILYFQPGTHEFGGAPLIFNSHLFITGPGGAVIKK